MEREKYVDESWKESATKEKEVLDNNLKQSSGPAQNPHPPQQAAEHKPDESARNPQPAPSQQAPETHAEEEYAAGGPINFINYLSSLIYQAMVFLGEMPNPATQLVEKDLQQAKLVIDTLLMLRQKTAGNLTKQENDLLSQSLYELQMRFVEQMEKEGQPHDR